MHCLGCLFTVKPGDPGSVSAGASSVWFSSTPSVLVTAVVERNENLSFFSMNEKGCASATCCACAGWWLEGSVQGKLVESSHCACMTSPRLASQQAVPRTAVYHYTAFLH